MIDLLRDKVADYVTKYSKINEWESVRTLYGAYTYLIFLCLATNEFGSANSLNDVIEIAEERRLESQVILNEIKDMDSVDSFTTEVLRIIHSFDSYDIERLYQEYISIDFTVNNSKVVFEDGKNSRDVLGSYYTQKGFAEKITKKAFADYMSWNKGFETLKIADYSCGGSAFLIAAIKTCRKLGIPAHIYGYDVDPVAVLISRVKTNVFREDNRVQVDILLGNPLLPKHGDCIEKFKKALSGRYYNSYMGINPVKNVDIVLGNPPWEKIRFEEKKFLYHFFPEKAMETKSDREKLLNNATSQNIQFYQSIFCDYEECKKYFKTEEFYGESSSGEVNTYALFTELSHKMVKICGVAGLIVKASFVKMPVYSSYFNGLTRRGELYDLYMFSNRNKIFNIDSREEFSVIYISRGIQKNLNVALNLSDVKEFDKCKKITLSYEDLSLINPETGMIPNIKNVEDLKFLMNLAKEKKSFGRVYKNCQFGRLVHLTNHSKLIKKQQEKGYIPIYEGKFIELYTGKYATYRNMSAEEKYKNKASAKAIINSQGNEYPESRFFIEDSAWKKMSKNFSEGYVVAWRSLTSATNRRTMLATMLPLTPTCQSIQILQLNDERQMFHVLALFDSIVFDYIVRLKMVGLDLTQTIIKQIPVPSIEQYEIIMKYKGIEATASVHILSRLKMLYQDDSRIAKAFLNYEVYDINEDRKTAIADIDHIIAFLYGISNDMLRNIINSFDAFYTEKDMATYFE